MKWRTLFRPGSKESDTNSIASSLKPSSSPAHSRITSKTDLSNVGASTDQIIYLVNSIVPPDIIRRDESGPSSSNGDVSLPRDAVTPAPPPSMSNGKEVQSVKAPSSSEREELATQLDSLADKYEGQKRWEDAIRIRGEAITHYRVLYDQDPDAHRDGLALALHQLGFYFSGLNRWEDACQASKEAVTLRRKLYELNPDAYRAHLALSLYSLGIYLGRLSRWEDAFQASEEAVTLHRKLYKLNPDTHRAHLADSLHELGVYLSRLNRWEDACQALEESVTLSRKLYDLNPDAYRDGLANSLRELGDFLNALERHGDALRVEEESIALYRAAHGFELDKDRAQADRVPQVTSSTHEVLSQPSDIPHSSNETTFRRPIPSITITPQDSSSEIASAASSFSEGTVKYSSAAVNIIVTPDIIPNGPSIPPATPPLESLSQDIDTATLSPLVLDQSVPSVTVTLQPGMAGHGSYAVIYRGDSDKGPVALKLLIAHPDKSHKSLERFKRESELWKRQSHLNILPFFGIHKDPRGNLYMISPWQDHGSLNDFLREYPEENRVKLLLHAARGMQYLHRQQPAIVHGDLRGANILVSHDRIARLADFGLSELIEDVLNEFPHLRPSNTTTSRDKGNVRWLAPEMVVSEDPPERSRATDVYSYGMTMIETFTGCQPFNSMKYDHHVVAALEGGERPDRPGADAKARGFTSRIWSLVRWCWRQNPNARPTANEIVSELEDIISE